MDIVFDPATDARNIVSRGLWFARAADFDWDSADIIEKDILNRQGAKTD